MTELQLHGLLNAVPIPAIYILDGTVGCLNAAAQRLFPGLAPGDASPGDLADCHPGTAASLELGGMPHLVTALPAGEGVLLTLHPRPELRVAPSVLARQLRQRLSVAMSAAQVITPVGDDEIHTQDYLCALNKSLYQILRIVRNLEQVDSEAAPLRLSAVDLTELCAFLYEQCSALCAEAGVKLRYDCKLPTLVTTGDLEKLTHMITSLLSNAVRAAGQGGQIKLRLAEKGGRAIVSMWNSGAGLSEDDLAAYWSGGSELPRLRDGLGLGLPLVQHIAHLHGGTVVLETGNGNGLTVTISLPIQPPHTELGRARPNRYEGMSEILVELADVLPARVFAPKYLE